MAAIDPRKFEVLYSQEFMGCFREIRNFWRFNSIFFNSIFFHVFVVVVCLYLHQFWSCCGDTFEKLLKSKMVDPKWRICH